MPLSAHRLSNLPAYVFAEINARVRELQAQGNIVIRLDVGSPDMPPPDAVIDSLERSARNPNKHGYTGYRGTAGFREAVARYYQRRFGVTLEPETEVLPLIGSKEGIVNLCMAYLDQGDIALVPDVGYPAYSQGARLAGADVHWVPMSEATDFMLDVESIPEETLECAKLLWANYPNNPTGAVANGDFYARLVAFCQAHDILLASDNPYADVTFDGFRAASVLEVPGAKTYAIEFVSMSKTFNMGGWRLGAAVGSPKVLGNLLRVKSNVDSGHFHAVYDAGVTAFDETPQSWIDARNRVYQVRRDRVLSALPQIGLEASASKGSLYVWARVLNGHDGRWYAERALNVAHVSMSPGEAFGPGGAGYVRISLAVHDEQLETALEQLKAWYQSQ